MATRTISTKLAIDGESEYRASLTRINSEIKTLQSALKLTESEFQNNANSMAALTAKGEALSNLYKAQENKVKELRAALQNAKAAEEQYAQQKAALLSKIEANNKALEELKNTTGDTSEEEARLNAENKELTEQLETCDANLVAVEKGINAWQTQLNNAEIRLNDLDAELELNNEYLSEAENSADHCATSIDRFGDRVQEAANKADTLRDALAAAGVIAALKATAEAMKACVDSSVEFESAMAGVAKTTDLTEVELGDMANAIQDLSTRIPATTTEIANVVEAAGQLGIAKEDLLSFAEVMVNLGEATNLSSTEAATALARFANVVGTSSEDYGRLGSVIVALGNNFATSEAEIVSMATRLSSTGAIVGLTESQIMALATTLSSVGIEAEAGGTAISKLLKKFETMVATCAPELESFAAVAGMSAEQFSQAWGNDAVSALSMFIDGLGRIDAAGGSSVAVLTELGIKEENLSRAVQSMSKSQGILQNSINIADDAWKQNTALVNEAATRYATTESKLMMLSNACNNVKIAIGDKLTPAVGNLASTGTKVVSWAADMIESSTLLVPLITAVATAIGVLAGGIVAYTAVTKLAAAAMGLFTAVLDTNPIFLAVTAVAALVAGIGVLVATLNDDATPSVKELTTAAQELPSAFEAANAAYKESETRIIATTSAAETYINRLRELEAQGVSTNEQQAEYSAIIDKIRFLLPGVNIELDEQTGLLIGGADALWAQVDAWKAVALQQALTTKYEAQIEAWANAELEVYENQVKLNQAQAEGQVLSQRLADVQQKMTDNYAEQCSVLNDTTLSAQEQTMKVWDLEDSWNSLYDEMVDIQRQMDINQDSQDTLTQAIEEGTTVAGEFEQQVTDAQAALEAFTSATGDAADGTDDLSGSMGQNKAAIQSIKDELKTLAETYKEAYDAAYDSINGQIGLFDTFAADISEDTNTVEKMMERWAQQTANLATYTENLKKAAQYGLDNGLVTSLSDGSTESAGYLATIIGKIEELGGTTENMSGEAAAFVSDFNAAFAKTEEAKESFASTVAAIETELSEGIERLESAAADVDFSGFNDALEAAFADVGVDFETIGVEAGNGLSQGIEGSSGTVSGASTDMANAAIDAARGTLGVHSPSTVFKEIGENVDAGMEQGIKGKVSVVVAAVKQMGTQMTNQMQQSAKQAVDAFDREFSQITNRASSTCSSMVSSASGAASGLPGAMTNIGVQAINGMISGLNSRSSALYSTISSIVSTAISQAQSAAAVHSPSRKTTEIFEYVGEGMVVGLENKRAKVAKTAQSVVEDALRLDIRMPEMPEINDIIPSIDSRTQTGVAKQETNIENHFHIESMSVRDDRDIRTIANELYRLQKSKARGRGVVEF